MTYRSFALALLIGACSSDDDNASPGPTGDASTAPTTPDGGAPGPADDAASPEPTGPTPDLEPLTGGNGPFIGAATGLTAPAGYVDEEFAASGTATSYVAEGELTMDGKWTFSEAGTAEYRTRILVRRPEAASDASGTVLVEWLNVSGGVDANPDYASLAEEIVRQGHVWVGVSAQLIGVEGGPVLVTAPGGEGLAGIGLVGIDPDRYGSLEHPGDGFAFDIFTQVARAVRAGGEILGGIEADLVIAAGESQSAIALTTYFNGVQPLTNAFDAFFIHSRGRTALPLVGPDEAADLTSAITTMGPALIRDDRPEPVMMLQAEGDVSGVLSSVDVRQPDTNTFRLWEVAGTAHADRHLLGSMADGIDCGAPINDGPLHIVAKAALGSLETWARGGEAPPSGPLLEVTDGTPVAIARDADGIALGGIRTPPVDVPVDVLSGDPGPSADLICILLGTTTPLPDARIAELYASQDAYVSAYAAATDAVIAAGFVLEADRDAMIGYSDPSRVTP